MISLEQIRLLESKITRAIDLIRVLKEENGALRKGLESAQKRMKELEALVEGFKADQHEIESVILRTLHTLDDLEDTATAARRGERAAAAPAAPPRTEPVTAPRPQRAGPPQGAMGAEGEAGQDAAEDGAPRVSKEELDIF